MEKYYFIQLIKVLLLFCCPFYSYVAYANTCAGNNIAYINNLSSLKFTNFTKGAEASINFTSDLLNYTVACTGPDFYITRYRLNSLLISYYTVGNWFRLNDDLDVRISTNINSSAVIVNFVARYGEWNHTRYAYSRNYRSGGVPSPRMNEGLTGRIDFRLRHDITDRIVIPSNRNLYSLYYHRRLLPPSAHGDASKTSWAFTPALTMRTPKTETEFSPPVQCLLDNTNENVDFGQIESNKLTHLASTSPFVVEKAIKVSCTGNTLLNYTFSFTRASFSAEAIRVSNKDLGIVGLIVSGIANNNLDKAIKSNDKFAEPANLSGTTHELKMKFNLIKRANSVVEPGKFNGNATITIGFN